MTRGFGGVDGWRKELGDAGDGDPGCRVVLCESTMRAAESEKSETVEMCLYRETETRNRNGKRRSTRAQCACQGQTRPSQVVDGGGMAEVCNADRIRKLGDGYGLKIRTSGSRRAAA